MTFDEAMVDLAAGKRIQRKSWANLQHADGRGNTEPQAMWIAMHDGAPWIFVKVGGGSPHLKWTPTATDRPATDWQVAA